MEGVWDGSFTSAAHWNGGRAADGGTDTIDASASTSGLTVTADGAVTRAQLLLKAQTDKPVTLDAIGSSFLMPSQTQASAVWPLGPFSTYLNGKSVLRVSSGGADWTRFHTQGAFQLTDASVKIWSPESGVAEVRVVNGTAGTFNAYDPNGVVTKHTSGALPCSEFFSDSSFAAAFPTVRFHCLGGVNTRFPSVTFAGYAPTTELVLDGGTHTAYGTVQLNSLTNRVVLTDEASLTFGLNQNAVSLKADSRTSFSGGTVVGRFDVGQRAELLMTNTSVTVTEVKGQTDANVLLRDVTLKGSPWSISTVSAIVSDSCLGSDFAFNFSGSNGTYVFTNVTGQTVSGTDSFKIANGKGSVCTLVLTGERTDLTANTSFHGFLGAGEDSTGTMTLEDGTFEFRPTSQAQRFNLAGGGKTATGILNIRGGTFISKICQDGTTASFGLGITQGTGFINVSGGTVDVSGLCICTEDSGNTEESVFRQTGGLVKIKAVSGDPGNGQSQGLWATGNGKKTRKARLALDGGVTEVNAVGGGSSAVCRGGTGWAAFEADGGTIRANGNSSFLLSHFDEATLGAKGLTVDSSGYTVTISQNLAKKADVDSAVLTLTGSGTKVINGTNTVAISVTGGTVGFSCLSDNRDVALSLAGGTSAYFGQGGAGNNRRFAQLAVGESDRAGILSFFPDEPLVVSGSVTLARVRVQLSDTYATGSTATLIQTPVEPSAATQAAWAVAVADGLADDQAADFTVVGNETDGWTFQMSVRARQDREIVIASGTTSNVTAEIVYSANETLTLDVGAGGQLALNGAVSGGTLTKTGTGCATISSSDSRFASGVTVNGGILAFPVLAALTDPAAADTLLTLISGTLQLGAAGEILSAVRVQTAAANGAVAVKCDADVAMRAPTTTHGCFVKRGVGTLTLVTEGTTALSSEAGTDVKNTMPPANSLVFGADGAVPSANYSALTVAEGDLVLKGTSTSSAYTMGGSGAVYIGMPVPLTQKPARLVVDGVRATFNGSHFHVGSGVRSSNNGSPGTSLVVTNGAQVEVTSFRNGYNSATQGAPRVRVAGEDSRLYVKEYLYAADSVVYNQTEQDPLIAVCAGARLWLPALTDGNANHALCLSSANAVLAFDNGRLSALNDLSGRIRASHAGGNLFFRNGSVCCISEVRVENDATDATFTFDDSEWDFGTADALTLTRPERITVKTENTGLVLSAAADQTRTFPLSVSGTGGLVKRGAGTVSLAAAPTFTGVCRVDAGVLTFAAGVEPANLRLAGAGTVANATLNAATIELELNADGSPKATLTFDNVTFADRTKVVLAADRLAEMPQGVVVARFVGTAPNVATWRLAKNDLGLSGEFSVHDGCVLMNVVKRGLVILFR